MTSLGVAPARSGAADHQAGEAPNKVHRKEQREVAASHETMGLSVAYDCVTDLLEQLSAKDAPPTNEHRFLSTTRSLRSPVSRATPKKSNILEPHSNRLDESKSFETEPSRASTNQEASTFPRDFVEARALSYEEGNKPLQRALLLDEQSGDPRLDVEPAGLLAELKMGHASLATLCRWTMGEAHYRSRVRPKNDIGFLSLETTLPPISSKANIRSHSESSTSRRQIWKKVWHKTRPESPLPQDGSFPVVAKPQQAILASDDDVNEEKKEEPRFQLFGSEYARYLVNLRFPPTSSWAPVASRAPLRQYYHRRSAVVTSRVAQNVEDANRDVQSGALLDIIVTVGKQPPPRGFHRLSQTASGIPFSLPKSSRNPKKTMYLHVKKESRWDKAAQRPCINALCLIFPDRGEFVPPGFCIVRLADSSEPANLSLNSDQKQCSERIYLCFRRSREGNPITAILPLLPQNGEHIPVGYTVVERSPRNHVAHLSFVSTVNTETSSSAVAEAPVFLAYRQRLASLESLRPLPLVMAVQLTEGSPPKLSSYYSTGGTVVASSIGRFHILDRSTHDLLSSSSVNNRLRLIEKSRRLNDGVPENGQEHSDACTISYLRSDDVASVGGGSFSRNSIAEFAKDQASSVCSNSTLHDDSQGDMAAKSGSLFSSLLAVREDSKASFCMIPQLGDDPGLVVCLEALNFIPSIEVAAGNDGNKHAVGRLPARALLLVPLLTACYTRHGGAALVAVESLVKLLTTTKFFQDDASSLEENEKESSTRLTLLDLAVQTVCDVSTSGAEETMFSTCVEFVEGSLRLAQGQLNTRTIGFVVRFYLFVFYFGVSVPTLSASRWPKPSWRPMPLQASGEPPDDIEGDFSMLIDPRGSSQLGYFPGGSPQAAAIAFKELISLSIVRLGKVSLSDFLQPTSTDLESSSLRDGFSGQNDPYSSFIKSLLNSIVEDATNLVERANYTQMALHQVVRSGGSELFWYDMINACGQGLFGKAANLGDEGRDIFIMVFAILTNLVKISSGKLRCISQTENLLPRDIASKLLSLELLLHFLEFWSDEQESLRSFETQSTASKPVQSIETFVFVIRRTVAPCLLWNTRAAIDSPQVFRRVIAIVSELWCSPIHRRHCKVELGVLMEHFALRILALGPELVSLQETSPCVLANRSVVLQQVEVIREVKNWFSNDPKDVIELFLNFDTDIASQITGPVQLLPGAQWKIFQRLCASLSDIADMCGDQIGNQIRDSQTKIHSSNDKTQSALSCDSKGFSSPNNAKRDDARLLRATSLDAISQIVKSIAVSAGFALGPEFVHLILSWSQVQVDSPTGYQRWFSSMSKKAKKAGKTSLKGEGVISGQAYERCFHEEDGRHKVEPLDTAFEIAQEKNIKKAIEYLIACNALTPAPRDIAGFLRIQRERLDPADLGNFISEGGTSGAEIEYWNSIRYLFVRAISVSQRFQPEIVGVTLLLDRALSYLVFL
jgi:hypothetical protein